MTPDQLIFVDSHAHVDDSDFDPDRAGVIERARAAGLRYILIAGGGGPAESIDSPLLVAEQHDWIYASAGVHPHEARNFTDSLADRIVKLAENPKIVAVGEIGLDYYYDHSPREAQKQVLIRQMELAHSVKLPVIIHCRDAWEDLRQVAANHWKSTGLGGILHCFTGSANDARAFMDWGFLISFAGNITFKKAENIREVAPLVPLDRVLTETDSPYLAPLPYRGKRNEPAFVRQVTQELARLRHTSEEAVAHQVLENFKKFVSAQTGRRSGGLAQ
jgi:TatD DNase family protein